MYNWLLSATYPGSASEVFAYDERNRLVEVSESGRPIQIQYDAVGRGTNILYANGTRNLNTFDAAGQLLSLSHLPPGGGTPLAFATYSYDLSGNRIAMQDKEGMHQYTYDGHNGLLSAAYPDGTSETFAYDPVGNRTNRLHATPSGTGETGYQYGSGNRLLATVEGGQTNHYAYDNIGRLTNQTVGGETQAYGYDFLSRMTQLVDTNGSVFAYAFDGEGNRTKQELNDCLETRFVYDGANVILELNVQNEPVQAYVNNLRIDQPLARISFVDATPRQRRTFHRDALGSVVGLSDENGALVQSYAYAAFGAIRTQSGADLNRITYTAREALGDSAGLYYYRYRVMDPSTGRFTTEDPLGFVDGPNRYVYVMNHPLRYSDPLGLESRLWAACKSAVANFFGHPSPIPLDAVNPKAHRNMINITKCEAARRALADCLAQGESFCPDEEKAARDACQKSANEAK